MGVHTDDRLARMERINNGMVLKNATRTRYIQPVIFFPASSLGLRFKLLHILKEDVNRMWSDREAPIDSRYLWDLEPE
jgi:hypothetical protein